MSTRLATLASLRRLDALAAKRAGTQQSGVMEVPAFVSLDEWQRAAVASQAALMAATREGLDHSQDCRVTCTAHGFEKPLSG